MNLQPLVSEILGRRPDMVSDQLRVTTLLQKAVQRVCQETLLLKTSTVLSPVAGDLSIGPYGESIYLVGDIQALASNGWESNITLTPLGWGAVTLRSSMDTTAQPVRLLPMAPIEFKEWLLAQTKGAKAAPGVPSVFCDQMGSLTLGIGLNLGNPYDQMVVEFAFEPNGYFLQVPGMPATARDAILALALAEVFEYPGRGMDKSEARNQRAGGLSLCGRLRGQAILGNAPLLRERSNPYNFQVR